MSPRAPQSLWLPISFVVLAGIAAAGSGFMWWRETHPSPNRTANDSTLPVRTPSLPPSAVAATSRIQVSPRAQRAAAPSSINKCLGLDGVPIYTVTPCPPGSELEKRFAVEIDPRTRAPTPARQAVPAAVASHPDIYVNTDHRYYLPSREERRDIEKELAWDRCERAKVRERAELEALGNKRTMRDIRRLTDHVVRECATYEVLEKG